MLQHSPRIDVLADPAAAWVLVSGEIDLESADELRDALSGALDRGPACWLDLTDLTFIDSVGVRELLRAQRKAAASGTCLLIRPPCDEAAMLPFELLGLVEHLPFVYDSLPVSASGRHLRAVPDATLRVAPAPAAPGPDARP